MTNNSNLDHLTAVAKLTLLRQYDVDNSGYWWPAVENLKVDVFDDSNAEVIIESLESHGVKGMYAYDEAMDLFNSYTDYLRGFDNPEDANRVLDWQVREHWNATH